MFKEEGATDIPVGDLMCIIVEEEADIGAFKDYTPSKDEAQPEKAPSTPPPAQTTAPPVATSAPPTSAAQSIASQTTPAPGARIIASPLAKVTAAQVGLSLQGIAGTGPGGRVIAADVSDAIAAGVKPAVDVVHAIPGLPAYTNVDVTKYRKVTAERLVHSKQSVPHYYLTVDCVVDEMLELRSKINAKAKDGEYKLSVNDFVIKAAATALRQVPEVNAQWMGDVIRMFHSADISIAVQTEQGLITPIVKDADRKGLKEISSTVKELAAKAKDNTLAPEEFMGGTFTISNLGMYGIHSFSAIVNPPQAAILAVGSSVKTLVPDETSETGYSAKTVMSVTLSCDHRVIDGAVGAQWLQAFKRCVEDPVEIIM